MGRAGISQPGGILMTPEPPHLPPLEPKERWLYSEVSVTHASSTLIGLLDPETQ